MSSGLPLAVIGVLRDMPALTSAVAPPLSQVTVVDISAATNAVCTPAPRCGCVGSCGYKGHVCGLIEEWAKAGLSSSVMFWGHLVHSAFVTGSYWCVL